MAPKNQQLLLELAYDLCSSQKRFGNWDAFTLRPGGSSLWTTASALTALGKAELILKQKPIWLLRCTRRGWKYLEETANMKPIGFNELTPCDADSTCWMAHAIVYRIANIAHISDSSESEWLLKWLHICINYLVSHVDQKRNGVRTYIAEDGIMEYINRQGHSSSWLDVHNCVTANVQALGRNLKLFLPEVAPEHSELFCNFRLGGSPFWWTSPEIMNYLNDTSLCDKRVPRSDPWTLRIPFHDDFTGNCSVYSDKVDVEGGLCEDSGGFSTVLSILACANSFKLLFRSGMASEILNTK